MQRLAEGVERRSPDIAVNNTNRTDHQRCNALTLVVGMVDIRFGLGLGAQVIGDIKRLLVKEGQLVRVRRADGVVDHDVQLLPGKWGGRRAHGGQLVGSAYPGVWQTPLR